MVFFVTVFDAFNLREGVNESASGASSISNHRSPISNLEHPFAFIDIDNAKTIFQIAYRRVLIAY
jgi:hypothetical protein